MGMALKKPEGAVGSAAPAIIIGIFVAFGGILYGYDTGTINGIIAMKFWNNEFATTSDHMITTSQRSLIVSILSAGTFFGALAASPAGDLLGRKWGLLLSCLVFTIGVILQTASTAIPLFVVGRLVAGLGVGLLSALVPMYQSESSPKWIRGTIVGCYQLAITIGLLLASIVNNSTQNRNDSGSYRIPIAVQFAWALILATGMLMLPETPRYLIKKGKYEKAAKSLSRLRRLPIGDPALNEELEEIRANHEYELSLGKATYADCFRGTLAKRTLTGCALQALQQLTGVNFIFYYGTQFFLRAGISNGFTVSLITGIVNVVSTFPGLYMVEKMGRRNLLLFGAVGMCVCQFIVAAVGTALPHQHSAQQALIAFVCIYIFFFACSWGPVAWVVTGELFPLKVRAKGLSMTTASNWLLNWAIAFSTPHLTDPGSGNANLGAKVFFIWGSFCGLCIIFVWFFIYETKGLSLEQVDELYEKVAHAWQSQGFVPTVNFVEVHEIAGAAEPGSRRGTLADLEGLAHRRRSTHPGHGMQGISEKNNEEDVKEDFSHQSHSPV